MLLEKTKISGIYKKRLKNGDISWYGKYRDPITKESVRKKLGTRDKDGIKNEKIAFVLLNELLDNRKKYNDHNPVNDGPEFKNFLTLTELFDIYYDNRVRLLKRKLREQYAHLSAEEFENSMLVKTKFKNQKTELHRFVKNVKPFKIATMNINTIQKKDVDNYIERDLGELPISQKTKFNIVTMIKTVINHAIKNDIVNIRNPFDHLRFKNPKRQRERVLSKKELADLLRNAKEQKDNINIYLSIYLAVLTGGRANTILNIRKKDIDLENQLIFLHNFKANKKYSIKISDEATEWFAKKILPYYEPEEFIIRPIRIGYRKTPPQPMGEIHKRVYELMDTMFNKDLDKKNNFDRDKVVNFHTIRRSIATNLVHDGANVYDVMVFLNHSSVEQTMKYLNMGSSHLNSAVSNLMSDIFKSI